MRKRRHVDAKSMYIDSRREYLIARKRYCDDFSGLVKKAYALALKISDKLKEFAKRNRTCAKVFSILLKILGILFTLKSVSNVSKIKKTFSLRNKMVDLSGKGEYELVTLKGIIPAALYFAMSSLFKLCLAIGSFKIADILH